MVKRCWSAIVVLALAVGAAFAQNQNTPLKEQTKRAEALIAIVN
jgi:hypothetical protein